MQVEYDRIIHAHSDFDASNAQIQRASEFDKDKNQVQVLFLKHKVNVQLSTKLIIRQKKYLLNL